MVLGVGFVLVFECIDSVVQEFKGIVYVFYFVGVVNELYWVGVVLVSMGRFDCGKVRNGDFNEVSGYGLVDVV